MSKLILAISLLLSVQAANAGCKPCGDDSFCCTDEACRKCGSGGKVDFAQFLADLQAKYSKSK